MYLLETALLFITTP